MFINYIYAKFININIVANVYNLYLIITIKYFTSIIIKI